MFRSQLLTKQRIISVSLQGYLHVFSSTRVLLLLHIYAQHNFPYCRLQRLAHIFTGHVPCSSDHTFKLPEQSDVQQPPLYSTTHYAHACFQSKSVVGLSSSVCLMSYVTCLTVLINNYFMYVQKPIINLTTTHFCLATRIFTCFKFYQSIIITTYIRTAHFRLLQASEAR